MQNLKWLHGTTIGENIFKEIAKVPSQYNLKWNLLKCVITECGKNMCGAEDFVGQIYKECEMQYF